MNRDRHNRTLWLLLGLSAGVHALLLSPWPDDTASPERLPVAQVQLSLATQHEAPTGLHDDDAVDVAGGEAKAQSAPEPERPAKKKPVKSDTAEPLARNETTPETPLTETETRAETQTVVDGEALHTALKGRLQHALLPHFDYPMLARKRGWEGTVRISIRIEADGTLSHLHMVEASKHRVLDEAAVNSLSRITRLPDADNLLAGRYVDLVLPVEYRLL